MRRRGGEQEMEMHTYMYTLHNYIGIVGAETGEVENTFIGIHQSPH